MSKPKKTNAYNGVTLSTLVSSRPLCICFVTNIFKWKNPDLRADICVLQTNDFICKEISKKVLFN